MKKNDLLIKEFSKKNDVNSIKIGKNCIIYLDGFNNNFKLKNNETPKNLIGVRKDNWNIILEKLSWNNL